MEDVSWPYFIFTLLVAFYLGIDYGDWRRLNKKK